MKFWGILVLFPVLSVPLWSEPPSTPSVSAPSPAPDPSPVLDPGAALAAVTPSPVDKGAEVAHLIVADHLGDAETMIVSHLVKAPRDPEWITLLAEVRIGQGREGEAVRLLHQANELGGPTAMRYILTGVAACIWKRTDVAEPQFRAAIEMDPFNPVPHYFLARLLYGQKRYDEAIQESKNAFSLFPGYVRAYENLGLCYEGKLDMKDAEYWFLEAIRHDEQSAKKTEWPSLDLSILLFRENRMDEAKHYLEMALAINPHNAQSLNQMGLLRERTGDYKGALESFQGAINADPTMESAYYQASRMSKRIGDSAQAAQYLSKFQELHAKDQMPMTPLTSSAPPPTPASPGVQK